MITISNESFEWLDRDGLAYFLEKLKAYISNKYAAIYFDTVENWDRQTFLLSEKGALYVYTDHIVDGDLVIPGFKVGDGGAYLIDLPFTDAEYYKHIMDETIHITQAERDDWNDKISCKLDDIDDETLILFK